jgi:uncharacterized membrane protein
MIHAAAVIAIVVWFGLNGLLWYAQPSANLWLLASAVLGVVFFAGFFLYLQWADQARQNRE